MSITLADMVSTRLKETGRSQRWLAREIGVSPQTVTNIIRGIRPDMATVERLAGFLNVPVSSLMRATGLAPKVDFAQEELVKVLGDDLSTLEIVNLVRRLPEREKRRAYRLLKIHLGED